LLTFILKTNTIIDLDTVIRFFSALVDALPADVRVAKPNDLLDREGYPRADIDVHSVRVIRNQLARLQFDHVEKMKCIEAALLDHHQSEPVKRAAPQAPIPVVSSKPAQALQPFLVVTSVHIFCLELTMLEPVSKHSIHFCDRLWRAHRLNAPDSNVATRLHKYRILLHHILLHWLFSDCLSSVRFHRRSELVHRGTPRGDAQ
jgi:hypothetical protein